ncbi:hypothetical protein [Citrobacter portucalensis]|nr:hypothetical protein [Citrobacter portucalensis]MCW8352519.1 hypothetical protein [Citrobacter portucalensis]MCX9042327.1 hypothetical protein [Citrobacter portucalensis]MCX9051790.1 hypothetical protein [Citrobacter portucalensis]
MSVIRPMKMAATLTIGVVIVFAGAALTLLQVSQAELKDTVLAAHQVSPA